MIWGVARYEMRMQLRSLIFWIGLVFIGLMFYSEIVQEPLHTADMVLAYRQDPERFLSGWQNPEGTRIRMEALSREGFPAAEAAGTWADRMQIVFTFVILFTGGFVFERDRLTRSREILGARPISPAYYLIGKFLGAALPTAGVALAAAVAAMGANAYANSLLGAGWDLVPYIEALLVILVPTILYAVAVVLALTALLPRGAFAVPVFLVYMLLGGIMPLGGKFRLDLSTFIVRSEGREALLWSDLWSTLLANRGFYLGLTVILVALATWLYAHRQRSEAMV